MKKLLLVGAFAAAAVLPSISHAGDSSCEFTCEVSDIHRFKTEADIYVAGTRGRCRGQILVSSIGNDAQIYSERFYVSEYIREGRSKRVMRVGIPFSTDHCRVEFSQEF